MKKALLLALCVASTCLCGCPSDPPPTRVVHRTTYVHDSGPAVGATQNEAPENFHANTKPDSY